MAEGPAAVVATRNLIEEHRGPSVPHEDWEKRMEEDSRRVVDMDADRGRDKVTIPFKGYKKVEKFDKPAVAGVEPLGPGHYAVAVDGIDAVKERQSVGGALPFGKVIGRDDVVGPRGQRPNAALVAEREVLGGMEGDILDLSPHRKPDDDRKIHHTFAKAGMYSDSDGSDDERLLLNPRLSPTRPNVGRGLVAMDKIKGRDNLFNESYDLEGDILDLSPHSIKRNVR